MNEEITKTLSVLFNAETLPSHEYLFNLADKVSSLLESEKTSYRPEADNGTLGALLDFTSEEELPVLIIPDLHARSYFLSHILNFKLPEETVKGSPSVLKALSEKKIRDLLHSELRGRERWLNALEDFQKGNFTSQPMKDEMQEGLTLLSSVMELKLAFPDVFHVLKGNHENIMNERGEGNFPFRKFADEGEMVYRFMQEAYGDDVLMVISSFEKHFPFLQPLIPALLVTQNRKRSFQRNGL